VQRRLGDRIVGPGVGRGAAAVGLIVGSRAVLWR